jgi:hypothetical protein
VVLLIQDGGYGSHLENPRWLPSGHFGFCILDCNARTEWQIDLIFVCGLGFTKGRFLSKNSTAQNPRWLPSGHFGFCILDCNARTECQIDLKFVLCLSKTSVA